eukprot:CAMPEP_0116133222 /NCGR_PEP_ID=MMETSP0329-20121206/9989_1 /TAXON_ID=697910 /ORGANISM="Pseudo-nitzschia arenysensis, Strain B593" /LENGTH=395 /DNA_ID=CAMNT_0003627835 /DNA_START=228 /DNA_END=1415 /DNA_ORIENTATION=-
MPVKYDSIPDVEQKPLVEVTEELPSSPLNRFGSLQANSRAFFALVGVCCGLLLLTGGLPETATTYLPSFLVGTSNSGAFQIELCAKQMNKTKAVTAVGATVTCWDKDPNSDDLMATGKTLNDGCARLTYKEDSWDGIGGRNPDIYCTVNKGGFVQAVPPDKDNHDQNNLAKFDDVTLYRYRGNDYGTDNGCGPQFSQGIGNDFASWALRFKKQCRMHDKCYYDCQIFLDAGKDAAKAEEFCDYEMYEGMKAACIANRGQLPGIGEDACLLKAWTIYNLLGGFYDKTTANCPWVKGKQDPSMKNKYGPDTFCHANGSMCGYDGTITDDLNTCDLCCEGPVAKDTGMIWDDHYCKCFPSEHFCGSTRIGNRFNDCNKCCSGGKHVDSGWTYSNYYCK